MADVHEDAVQEDAVPVDAVEVDARGRPCPLPVIDLARAIDRVDVGQAVALLADDAGAATDVPAWCRMREQSLEDVTDLGDHTRYLVRRRT